MVFLGKCRGLMKLEVWRTDHVQGDQPSAHISLTKSSTSYRQTKLTAADLQRHIIKETGKNITLKTPSMTETWLRA